MKIDTPEKLMRSRYDAFVKEDWKYIAETSLHQTLEELSSSTPVTWIKLEVLKAYDDIVEFKAYYKVNEKIELLHERSNFVKINNEWKYKDGTLFPTEILSNDPCPCGSGKKFKKCCK